MTYTEINEFPEDVLPHGTFKAVWQGFYLRLQNDDTRVPTDVSFPGSADCTVTITASTILVNIELNGGAK